MSVFIEYNPDDRAEMELLLPRLLILAGEQTERAGDQVIFSKFDLNVSRFSLLASLARSPRPLSMTEVKDFMVRSPANLTQMVDYLEERKLVRRVPREGDRRVHLLELTDEGYRLLGQVKIEFEKTMRNFLKGQSDEKLQMMVVSLIEVIHGMMRIQGLEPPKLKEA